MPGWLRMPPEAMATRLLPAAAHTVLSPSLATRPAPLTPAGVERSPVLHTPRAPRQLSLPLFGSRRA